MIKYAFWENLVRLLKKSLCSLYTFTFHYFDMIKIRSKSFVNLFFYKIHVFLNLKVYIVIKMVYTLFIQIDCILISYFISIYQLIINYKVFLRFYYYIYYQLQNVYKKVTSYTFIILGDFIMKTVWLRRDKIIMNLNL